MLYTPFILFFRKNGVHEFTLVRGDAEEQFEREMKNTFNEQTTKEGACFQSNSSANIDECCEQVLDTLTSSNNQAIKPLQGALSSNITQRSNTGNYSLMYGVRHNNTT